MASAIEPPPRLAASAGSPDLGEPEAFDSPELTAPAAAGRWTPEAVRVLFMGIFSVMAAWRGPHWQYTEEEGGPLIDPTTAVFNETPGVKDIAPQHVALLIMVAGWGTMGARRMAIDKAIAQYMKEHPPGAASAAPEPPGGTTASPYGPNKLEGRS